jgi:hypothetical protein
MVGKKNIVFGFIYLVLTAALGPYMVKEIFPGIDAASTDKQAAVGELQLLANSDFERDLVPLSGEAIAKTNSRALLALNSLMGAEEVVDAIKGGPHAHGNLEALLNIAAGLALCFVAAGILVKQLISWLFILGALLHSGMLYLAIVFNLAWAGEVLQLGIGPLLLLLALLLMGIVTAFGFRGEVVRDD